MISGRIAMVAALLLAATPQQIWAQQAQPAAASTDIVVKGLRPDQGKRNRDAVTAIGNPVSQGGFDAQFGRWEEPVCVGVIGLPVEPAQFIADRIGATARDLKIGALGPRCHPNIYVIATADPAALIEKARGSRSGLLSNIAHSDVTEMEHSHAPVRWASLSETTGAMGDSPTDSTVNTGSPHNNVLKAWTSSHIRANTRAVIQRMVVIVDLSQVHDQSYQQLAAYLTLVSLAQLRPHADAPMVNTILSAYRHDGTAPDDLTDFDRAYLKSLYAMPPDVFGTLQKQALVSDINRSLTSGAAH